MHDIQTVKMSRNYGHILTENVTGVASFPARNKHHIIKNSPKMFGSLKNTHPHAVLNPTFFLLGNTKGHFEKSVSPYHSVPQKKSHGFEQ